MANERLNILRLLIENQGEIFSIRSISLSRKINYKSAYQAVMKLEQEGAVTLQRAGNTLLCSFNRKFNNAVFTAEYARREDLLKNKNFEVLTGRLRRLKFPFIALLFGSFAKGNATKHSDIDLLAIAEDGEPIEDEISLLPLKIHLTCVSYGNFLAMLKSKERTVVSEAIKKNIILVGIEEYYRLMNDA